MRQPWKGIALLSIARGAGGALIRDLPLRLLAWQTEHHSREMLSWGRVARIPPLPRLERRSASVLLACAVCGAALLGAVRGAVSVIENGYFPLGMHRLVAVTLQQQMHEAI